MGTLKGWLTILVTSLLAALFFYLNTNVDPETISFKLNCGYGLFWSVLTFYFVSAEDKQMKKQHHGVRFHQRAWVNFILFATAPFRAAHRVLKRFKILR